MVKKAKRGVIRFYGSKADLAVWRNLVAQTVGKEGGVLTQTKEKYPQWYFEAALTTEDRDALNAIWRGPAREGVTWNECISYEVR